MKILIASDHAGFEMKNELKKYIEEELHITVEDRGAFAYDMEDDFTDILAPVGHDIAKASFASATSKNSTDSIDLYAIVLGGSGQGEAMIMNRFPGVRAAVYYGGDTKVLTLSREHNNANALSLGARFVSVDEAKQAVRLWLQTDFSKVDKYIRRNDALDQIERTVE